MSVTPPWSLVELPIDSPCLGSESDYLRMLREAQRESDFYHRRSNRNSFSSSTGWDLAEEVRTVLSKESQKDWRTTAKTAHDEECGSSTMLLLSNIISLLIGAGIGIWLVRRKGGHSGALMQ